MEDGAKQIKGRDFWSKGGGGHMRPDGEKDDSLESLVLPWRPPTWTLHEPWTSGIPPSWEKSFRDLEMAVSEYFL